MYSSKGGGWGVVLGLALWFWKYRVKRLESHSPPPFDHPLPQREAVLAALRFQHCSRDISKVNFLEGKEQSGYFLLFSEAARSVWEC